MSSITNQFIADKLNSKSYDDMIYIMDQLNEDTKSLLHILTKPEPKQKRVDSWEIIEGDVFIQGRTNEILTLGGNKDALDKLTYNRLFSSREIDVSFNYLGKKYTHLVLTRDNIDTLPEFIDICKNIVEENTNIRGFVLYERKNNTEAWFRSKTFPISKIGYNPRASKIKRTSYILNI